ncbi:SRPBCC family protein [Myxococcota bacterium]|nr:SRPBCC family protein [Myxococcota bacterium]
MNLRLLSLLAGLALATPALFSAAPAAAASKAWHVDRTVQINARPEILLPQVADLNNWATWTVWNAELDPECVWTFSGEPGQVGHTMEWDGKVMGWGKLTLTEVSPTGGVKYDIWLMKPGGDANKGSILFAPAEGGTQVTWSDDGQLKGISKLFAKKIEAAVGADFDANLNKLKVIAEAQEAKLREQEAAAAAAKAAEEAAAAAKAAEEAAAAAKAAEEAAAAAKAAEEAAAAAAAKGKKKK